MKDLIDEYRGYKIIRKDNGYYYLLDSYDNIIKKSWNCNHGSKTYFKNIYR